MTFVFFLVQPTLPRLPIPDLGKTCHRYLDSQRALLQDNGNALQATEGRVRKFLRSEGLVLDRMLRSKDAANKHTSYINGPWTEMYLKDRRPVAFTHTPGVGVTLPLTDSPEGVASRVAQLLISSMKYYKAETHHTGSLWHTYFAKTT